jgi:hypothetical protein
MKVRIELPTSRTSPSQSTSASSGELLLESGDRGKIGQMRLWSLHPSFLDPKGLVALWREALLAQKVLQGKTTGYRFHPQLHRFRRSDEPLVAISMYLWPVHDEAARRGYAFDASKIALQRQILSLAVTQGQLAFEHEHLKKKLRHRDPERFRVIRRTSQITAHPLFVVVTGKIEPWEKGR